MPAAESSEAGAGGVRWDLVIQVLGATAALTGWIAVVGGARVWAKLHAAEIPATHTLSVLPRQQLITEGLQSLLVPLLLGAGLAVFVYYTRTRSAPMSEPLAPRAIPRVLTTPRGAAEADRADGASTKTR